MKYEPVVEGREMRAREMAFWMFGVPILTGAALAVIVVLFL